MANIQDYFTSTKPAKLMLCDEEGNETGDYLGVIALDAAKVSRARSKWSAETVMIDRELKEIDERAVDGDVLSEDVPRKSELNIFIRKESHVEFALTLLDGSSFNKVTDDDMRELLHQGDIAIAVINLSADADRLKKKRK